MSKEITQMISTSSNDPFGISDLTKHVPSDCAKNLLYG